MVLIAGAARGGDGTWQPVAANIKAAAAIKAATRLGFLECDCRIGRSAVVWLIILEAALALALLVFIVWWTMFHGRRKPPRQ
jgi:hypothetical protein